MQKRKLPRFSGVSDCLESYFVGVVKAFSKLHPEISLLRTVAGDKPYFKLLFYFILLLYITIIIVSQVRVFL